MEKETVRRKEILIDPAIQWRMVLLVVVPMIIFMVFIFLSNHFVFEQIFNLNLSADDMKSVIDLKNKLFVWIFIIILVIPNIVTPLTFVFSHRVTGPIYQLKRRLEDFNDGKELRPVKFRPKDFFISLSEEFNKFAEKIKK